MSAGTRLVAVGAGLAVVLAGGFAIGSAVGGEDSAAVDPDRTVLAPAPADAAGHDHSSHDHGSMGSMGSGEPGGLAVSQDGVTLALDATSLAPGRRTLTFRILDAAGAPVTGYDTVHEKELHLIAVRRDGDGFQHVHPTLDADGRWSVPLQLTPGAWRVFADFTPSGGDPVVLGADLAVPGAVSAPSEPPVRRVAVVDGYRVELGGDLAADAPNPLTFTVTRGGRPVTDLQSYLGAFGHLVVLREGDLGYLHAHPGVEAAPGETSGSAEVDFEVQAPSPGRYRLYLDFRHGGVVRTATFVLEAPALPAAPEPTAEADPDDSGDSGASTGGTGHDHH